MSDQPVHHSVMTKTDGNAKFIFMMLAFIVLSFLFENSLGAQDRAIDQIAVNTVVLQNLRTTDCQSGNETATEYNALVDELVQSVSQGKSLPPAEQQDRIARYSALKVPVRPCTSTK